MPLNPNANAFSFNPNAPTFSFGAEEKKEEPAAAPAAAAPAAAPAAEEPKKAAAPAPAAEEPKKAAEEPKKAAEAPKKAEPKAAAPAPEAEEPEEAEPAHDFKPHDPREHLNIVFIGHVDSGKSTISGQILLLTGQVDERTIAKYEREAKDKNRDSWYLAYIMDTNEEERSKGKTVEVGRASFGTDNKRYTLLDAPGHKSYVPNMINGASQADVAVLIISARKSEFEAGFDRGGQTREHALLAKTLGVQRLVVAINKMDEQTVKWSQKRYDEIVGKVGPFLRKTGFKPNEVSYVPVSGLTGLNLKEPVSADVCPWLEDRRSLVQELDRLKPMNRDPAAPLRVPLIARYKDMGQVCALGKVQAGTLVRNSTVYVEPVGHKATVVGIDVDEEEVDMALPGENVVIRLKGVEEDQLNPGFVVCGSTRRPKPCLRFNAQLAVMELLEHNPVITVGYTCILHVHTLAIECQIVKLIKALDKKTGKAKPTAPKFCRQGDVVICRLEVPQSVVVDTFTNIPQLGRFTLRDEGKTIAIGKITKLPNIAPPQ